MPAQQRKEIHRYRSAGHSLAFTIGHGLRDPRPDAKSTQRLVSISPRSVVLVRDVRVLIATRNVLAVDSDELIRVGIRQRTDENRVDGGEDRGRHADAKRDALDCRGSEPGALSKRTHREPHVIPHTLDYLGAGVLPVTPFVDDETGVADCTEIAEDARGLMPRVGRRQSLALEVVHAHCEVKRDFVVDVRARIPPPEAEVASPAWHVGPGHRESSKPFPSTFDALA